MKQVINILKLKTNQEIKDIADHNLRVTNSRNVNKQKTKSNKYFVGNAKTDTIAEMNKRLEKVGKYRKDANKIVNIVFSASPEFFETATKKDIEEWELKTQAFIEETFGKENIIYAVIHYDEKTPHFHVCLTPIKDGKLRSNYWFDGPAKLKKFHTDYSKAIKDLGIKRGDPFIKSSQVEIEKFYKKVNASTVYERKLDKKLDELFTQFENPTLRQKLNPWGFLNNVVKPLFNQLSSNLSHYRTRANELRDTKKQNEYLKNRVIDLELKLENLGLSPKISFLQVKKIREQIEQLPKAPGPVQASPSRRDTSRKAHLLEPSQSTPKPF